MIKAILIDDEKSAQEMLGWLLETYCPNVTVMATCSSGLEGLGAIQAYKPDLVFLDIEMPGMNGFEMLEKLSQIDFGIVFTTAHDQFAAKAFRYAALDYLLKPIDPEDLKSTITRFTAQSPSIAKEQLNLLLESMSPQKKVNERIALSTSDGLVFVKTADISYCKADSNYTHVIMADGRKITVARTLKEIDETLGGEDFVRVHNSFLVNINHIQKYVKEDGGYVIMPDKAQISISRSKRDDFFQLFSRF
jgi:two-component system, LytTR family, response regulator